MPIVRINEFQAAEGRAADLVAFLRNVVEVVSREPGCLSVQLLVGHDAGDQLAIIETWDSVEAHQAAAKAIPPEQLALVRPLLGAPPRGRYFTPA